MTDTEWPSGRTDYILVRRPRCGPASLQIRDCARVFTTPAASDHYGVTADLDPV